MREEAAPGQHFTTYNVEVADFHTYFAGQAPVWVHNRGTVCERIAGLYVHLRDKRGLAPWAAFEQLVIRTERLQEIKGPVFRLAAETCMDDVFRAATQNGSVDLSVVRSYRQVENFTRSRRYPLKEFDEHAQFIGHNGLEIHHTVPKYLMNQLGISADELDDVPAMLLTADRHRGQGPSFHNILREAGLPPGGTYERQEILEGLADAYRRFGQPDVWRVAQEWLRRKGIQ